MKSLKILLVGLVLMNLSCSKEEFRQADNNTETIRFTKLGGFKILTVDKVVSQSGLIKKTQWYYENYLDKKDDLKETETDGNGLLLENEWLSISIPNTSRKYVVAVKPNMSKRKRNVFFRMKGDVEFSFNLYQD